MSVFGPGRRRGRLGAGRLGAGRLGAGLLAGGLGLVLSACSLHPFVPATTLQSGAGSGSTTAAVKPALGVDLLASRKLSVSTIEHQDETILRDVKDQLHASRVGLVWYLYSPGDRSDVVEQGPRSATPQSLLLLGREAESLGLSVSLRPIIEVEPCTTKGSVQTCGWEGRLDPPNPSTFFSNLLETEQPYLAVAGELSAVSFVVETEMNALGSRTADWTSFFEKASLLAPGVALEGTASVSTYFTWHGTPAVLVPNASYANFGLDFYPISGPVTTRQFSYVPALTTRRLPPDIATGQLASLMEGVLRLAPGPRLRRTTIDETGIGAARAALDNPADWVDQEAEKTDPQVQATWISAVCEAVLAEHLRGVYFFNIDLDNNPPYWPHSNVTFMGRPRSEAAFRGCAALFAKA